MKIALIVSILGLLTLASLSNFLSPEYLNPEEIKSNNMAKIKGTVSSIQKTKNSLVFEVIEARETKILIPKSTNLNISKGDEVEIIGKYGENLVIADKVRIINYK